MNTNSIVGKTLISQLVLGILCLVTPTIMAEPLCSTQAGGRDDLDPILGQQRDQPFAQQRVVLDDHDPDRRRR